ncbi:MAG: hypothetical protein U0835_05690 [Isosphaeraceae bacterium]
MFRSTLIALSLCVLAGPAASRARAQLVFGTPAGSTTSGGSVLANASFTLSNGRVLVALSNLLGNPTADSQQISAVLFSVSGATATGSLASTNQGQISTISAGGSYTAGVSDPLTRWEATRTGSTVELTTLTGGAPNRLIIGPDDKGNNDPSLGGLYSNANPSITNNHNPSVLGTATFDITIAGVTSSSTVSNVVFQFGTAAGSNLVNGTALSVVPEPSSLLLGTVVAALGGVGLFRRQRRRKAS